MTKLCACLSIMIMIVYIFLSQNSGPSSSTGSASWHHTFKIPERSGFSGSVQKAIDTGFVSAKARREINQTLRTLLLQHSRYNTACSDYYGIKIQERVS